MKNSSAIPASLLLALLVSLGGCGGDDDDPPPPPPPPATHTVGGTVTGLGGGTLTLHNNGGNALAITQSGNFTFTTPIASGSTFNVTIATQPANPTQVCTLLHGSGTMGGNDITNVAVDCVTSAFTLGGSVSGLAGTGLVLQNSGGANRPIAGNGDYAFPTAIPSGNAYDVTVLTQPSSPLQTCTVANAQGIVGAANITNANVTCTSQIHRVGGAVAGLLGTGLALTVNGGSPLAITHGGDFQFPAQFTAGTNYTVAIATQPANPSQSCTVSNASGTLAEQNVNNVSVFCPRAVSRFVFTVLPASTVNGPGSVGVYQIDATTGALTPAPGSPFPAGIGTSSVGLDPRGRFVYATNESDGTTSMNGNISGYRLDPVSGALTPMANTFPSGVVPQRITVNPAGTFAYTTGDFIEVFAINQTSGELTSVPNSQIRVLVAPSLVFHPSGGHAYLGRSGLVRYYSVNVDGTLTERGESPPSSGNRRGGLFLTMNPSARFIYATGDITGLAYLNAHAIDDTEALSEIPGNPHPPDVNRRGIAFDPQSRFAFVSITGIDWPTAPDGPGIIERHAIDPTSYAPSPGAPVFTGTTRVIGAPYIDGSGRFLFVTQAGQLLTMVVDPVTGALSAGPARAGTDTIYAVLD